jgi:hypothetical protein
LLVALRDPLIRPDDYPVLAAALAAVSERLPPTRAADHPARALDVFLTRLRDPRGGALAYPQLVSAVVALSPGLDAAAAARGAETLGAMIRQSEGAQVYWPGLATALAAVCRRLPASDAAAHVNRTVDFIIQAYDTTKEKEKALYSVQVRALGALCGGLDAARASRTAGAIIAILGDSVTVGGIKQEFISSGYFVAVLPKVAERLDAPVSLEAAENLVRVLRKSRNIVLSKEDLRGALVAVCRRLDAAGAARVAEAVAAAARDPQTPVLVRTLFADALAALAGRLTPDQAAALESALVDSLLVDLADPKSRQFSGFVGQALATACGRPGATDATRAAEALGAAIREPQTPLATLKPLADALAVVNSQLPPKEASSHTNRTVELLDSLWVARTAPSDRASVAEALAAVWTCLGPTAAATRARRTAADLEDALRDAKTAPNEIADLAKALARVYTHLDPTERRGRANAVADVLVATLKRPGNGPLTIPKLSEALALLCAHQDHPGTVRVASALLAILDDPNDSQFRFALPVKTFKTVAARLDERDLQRLLDHPLAVGPLQRALLEVAAGTKNRSFRNTWDYLNATEPGGNATDALSPGTNR